MSTQVEVSYLDGEFTITSEEPSLVSELAPLLGGEAEVVSEAVDNLRYRNKYPRVYRLVSADVAKNGFPREVKEKKTLRDGTVKDVLISEMDHLRKYLATGDDARAKLGELFAQYEASEPIYKEGEGRAGGSGKISQAALDTANNILARGDEALEKVVTHIESTLSGFKIGRDADGNVTPESLARAIQALQKDAERKAKEQAKKGLLGAIAG